MALVNALVDGRIQTRGAASDWLLHVKYLPQRLRLWVIDEIHRECGEEIAKYIQDQLEKMPDCRCGTSEITEISDINRCIAEVIESAYPPDTRMGGIL
ncbi:hypothetical protein [Methanoregula sp.]|uniref:hypothetical protein n=1 Tax=Methanoregula sp. TaxID=2052170 RepID=UPI003C72643B